MWVQNKSRYEYGTVSANCQTVSAKESHGLRVVTRHQRGVPIANVSLGTVQIDGSTMTR